MTRWSHTGSPVLARNAVTLPFAKPAMTTPDEYTGEPVPRSVSTGTGVSNVHRRWPSFASSATRRPSDVCTNTRSSPVAGVESTSLDTRTRHFSDPSAADSVAESAAPVHDLLLHKYYVDELYDAAIVQPIVGFSRGVDGRAAMRSGGIAPVASWSCAARCQSAWASSLDTEVTASGRGAATSS